VSTYRGASLPFRVDAALTRKVQQVARQERATLFSVSLAAFAVLLARWSGQLDMVVGVPVAGRRRPEVEGLIGCFVNTLALRIDVSGDPAFTDVLRQVRGAVLRALTHQDLPFELLVERMNPERSLGRNPLVQVMFQVDSIPRGPSARSAGLGQERLLWGESESSHFDLSVRMVPAEGGLQGKLVYATDLFDRDTIERTAAYYLRLLEKVSDDPRTRVSALTLAAASREA
jgi:non-ribosomal peptide synthetase component F